MTDPATSASRWLTRPATTVLLILMGLGVSIVMFSEARSSEQGRIRDDMKRRADTRHNLIRENLQGYEDGLHSLANVFGLLRVVGREKFQIVARDTLARYPGYLSLEWVPVVPHSEREAFEANGKRIHKTDRFTITSYHADTSPAFPFYYPVLHTEGVSGSLPALGQDYLHSPLQSYFERARSSGQMIVSEQTQIATSTGLEPGLLMIYPVFSATSDSTQTASASREFYGFIVGTFRTTDFFGATWQHFKGNVTDVLIVDYTRSTDQAASPIFYWDARRETAATTLPEIASLHGDWNRELTLTLGERLWVATYRIPNDWFAQQQSYIPAFILGAGLLTSLLFAAYLRSLARRADTVESQVVERTAQLLKTQSLLEQDIAQREQTELLLLTSQQQLHGLMENSPNAIFFKDTEGRYISVNPQYAELYGRQREDFPAKSDIDLFSPEIAARIRISDARVITTAQPFELEDALYIDGILRTSIVHKFPLLDTTGKVIGLCGISTDISERKKADAEIRESRRQLEAILGQLPGMAFRLNNDPDFTPLYVSLGALTLTGFTARDFLDKKTRIAEIIHPEDRTRVQTAITDAVKKHRAYEIEYRIVDRSAKVKWVLDRGQGVYDSDGRLLSVEGLAIDITQRKDAEAEKLFVERRLLEGQKLESIGVLAGGIAHDFNNLLTGIMGNANLAALEIPRASPIQQNLKQIETASLRAAELCQQMLAYAGKGRYVVQRMDLGSLVETAIPLINAAISKRVTLRLHLKPALPAVMADAVQLRQIIMNLIVNASESFGERDGEITVTTESFRPSISFFEKAIVVPPETSIEFIKLEVRDTGSGMAPETLAKIFDPFFTTKFAGRGLGLAAVQGIVRSHRGGILVESSLGKGSVFTICIPTAPAAKTETTQRPRITATPWKKDGKALIIDDEDHVLKVAASMLRTYGLHAEIARDGYEGIDLFRANPSAFDLVLLDMTMPRLSGEETLKLLREIRPDIRVLFMSGYNRREVVDTLSGQGQISFVQKPFTLESLREQIQLLIAD